MLDEVEGIGERGQGLVWILEHRVEEKGVRAERTREQDGGLVV